jgi:uncharacterized membrane protein
MWPKVLVVLWAAILALDIPWVLINTKFGFYRGHVNGVVTNKLAVGVMWIQVALLLALSITGVLYYAPAKDVVWIGMFLGFAVYFIFNTTSLSMFQWSIVSAIGDTLWGTVLCGVVATIGLALVQRWRKIDPAIVNPAAL